MSVFSQVAVKDGVVGYELQNDDGPLFVTVETALVDVFTKLAGILCNSYCSHFDWPLFL